jgi:4-carboxymuconolactone decarboxylase
VRFAVTLGLALLATAVAAQQPLPIENVQLRGDRFRGLHYREMTEEQRAMLYNVVNSARAVTNTTGNGPFNVLLRSPAVGDVSQQLGNTIRFSSGLSGRLRELATLMAGRAWTSTYEWYAHARYARDEGIETTVIEAIAANRRPDLTAMPVEDAMVWRVTDELLYTRRIADATYGEALTVLGEQRLFAVVTIAAYYEYVSMLLNVDRYPLPADAPPEAAAAARALAPLTAAELKRDSQGPVSARPEIRNDDVMRVLDALGAEARRETSTAVQDVAADAVMRRWHGGARLNGELRQLPRDAFASLGFLTDLLDKRFVSDAHFALTLQALDERGVVNLIVLLGHANIRCAQQALAGSRCEL